MPHEQPARIPPKVIRVLPPDRPDTEPYVIALLAGLFGLGGVFFVMARIDGKAGWPSLHEIAFFGIAAITTWSLISQNRQFRRARAHYVERLGVPSPDPIATSLAGIWKRPGQPPSAETVTHTVAAHLTKDEHGGCACLVCLGPIDVPHPADYRFEPVIIRSPVSTDICRRAISIVLAVLGILVLRLLLQIPVPPPAGPVGVALLIVIGAAVEWLWRVCRQASYVRLAPGMIQTLKYGLLRSKPTIHSYPMSLGTLVIVTQVLKRTWLVFIRGDVYDVLDLTKMRDRDELLEQIFQALLSTAPTPPLSDEELVG